jgi:hypothetical protein
MEGPPADNTARIAERFRAGVIESRWRGLTGSDLTSFALLHLVADVLMLRTGIEPALTPMPARVKSQKAGAPRAEHR